MNTMTMPMRLSSGSVHKIWFVTNPRFCVGY